MRKLNQVSSCPSRFYLPNKNSSAVLRHFSHVRLFATPRTVACQSPMSMGFFRQEYWSGLPFPSPGNLSNPGFKPVSPALAGGFVTTELPGKPQLGWLCVCVCLCVCVLSRSVISNSYNPIDCSLPGSSMGFSRQDYWSGLPFPSPGVPLIQL